MHNPDRPRSRRGFTLAELMIAMGLLAAAAAVMAPLLLAVATQRQAAQQRQVGLLMAENLLDDLLARGWDDPAPVMDNLFLPVAVSGGAEWPVSLPGLEQRVAVVERTEDAARQITVEIRWHNRAGDFTAPVRISGWKFSPEGANP